MIIPWLVAVYIAVAQSCSEHSLMFTYTYMTNPPADRPGLYAESQLNGQTFESYNSWTNVSHCEAEWARHNASLCTRTDTHSNKHRWFKTNTDAMVERLNLSASDNHVLQWTHGCEAREDRRGQLVFTDIVDAHVFNGEPLLHANSRTSQYEGTDKAGMGAVIAAKWNDFFNQDDFDYYRIKCMDMLIRAEEAKAFFYRSHQKNT